MLVESMPNPASEPNEGVWMRLCSRAETLADTSFLSCVQGLCNLDIPIGPLEKRRPVRDCGVAPFMLPEGEFAVGQPCFDLGEFRCAKIFLPKELVDGSCRDRGHEAAALIDPLSLGPRTG